MNASPTKAIVLTLTLAAAGPVTGAVSVGYGPFGGSDCRSIANYVADNWWDLRSYMTSDFGATGRPKGSDFKCVSPALARDLVAKPVPGHQDVLQCFASGSQPGICCDRDLQSCVSYAGH